MAARSFVRSPRGVDTANQPEARASRGGLQGTASGVGSRLQHTSRPCHDPLRAACGVVESKDR